MQRMDRLRGLFLNPEIINRRKAQRPQDAQRVLLKAQGRLPNTAKHARRQILAPVKSIHQARLGVPRHGVDGEIPAG